MATFHDSGQMPRFQSIAQVSQATVGNGVPGVTTKSGVRQFEWNTQVTLEGSTTDNFEAGLIQNLVKFTTQFRFSNGDADPKPVLVNAVMNPLPVLDSKTKLSPWLRGSFRLLGPPNLSGVLLPPGMTVGPTTEAFVSEGDDPGAECRLVQADDPTKRLAAIDEDLLFVTWLAVRNTKLPAADLSSYIFLRHTTWSVKRKITVYTDANGGFIGAPLLRNDTKMESFLQGQGSRKPVLAPPIANEAVRFFKA